MRQRRSDGVGVNSLGTNTLAWSRSIGSGGRIIDTEMNATVLKIRLQNTPCDSGSNDSENSACGRSSHIPNGPP